jgi:hypothetical protein
VRGDNIVSVYKFIIPAAVHKNSAILHTAKNNNNSSSISSSSSSSNRGGNDSKDSNTNSGDRW